MGALRDAALMLARQGAAVTGTEDDAEHPGPANKRRVRQGRHMRKQGMGGSGTGAGKAVGRRRSQLAGRMNGFGAVNRAAIRYWPVRRGCGLSVSFFVALG